jgi:hypothetical protein
LIEGVVTHQVKRKGVSPNCDNQIRAAEGLNKSDYLVSLLLNLGPIEIQSNVMGTGEEDGKCMLNEEEGTREAKVVDGLSTGVKSMNGGRSAAGNADIDVQALEVAEFGDPCHEAENGETGVVAGDRELAEGGEFLEVFH